MKAIKLGIVGCGIVVKELHYPALVGIQDLFKIEGSQAEQGRVQMLALSYSKRGAIPILSRVDAVDIAIPTHLNAEV